MVSVLFSVTPLLGGIGILLLGHGLLGTLVGVGLADMNVGATVSGIVMASYFLGLILGALKVSSVIGAVGHVRTFAALASVYSAASLAHAFLLDPWLWGCLRLVEGFTMAGLFMCAESWLNARGTAETRGALLSAYMIITYFFQGVAQFLLLLGQTTGFMLFALVSILTSVALVPVTITRIPAPDLPEISSFSLVRLFRISPTGMFGALTAGLVLGSFYSLGPLYARTMGLDLTGVALFMSAVIIGGLLLQWPLGRLSDRMDRRFIIAGTSLALVLACLFLIAGQWVGIDLSQFLDKGIFLGSAVLFGAVVSTLYPVSVALVNDWLDPVDMVSASGGLLFTYSIGAVIGPLVASAIMEGIGPSGLFLFSGFIALGMFAYTILRMRIRDAAPDDEKLPFQIVARTTPVATELDPRADYEDGQLSFDFNAPAPVEEDEADLEDAERSAA
ncbi:MFS transporter [Rhodospirillum sp. A1_3_36]|uniref:MFS transporter n=1 Tax=Rhodospirillum sp. A1_3_36 TaxID=3391666 RepID=UPI0039A530C9